MKEFWMGSQDSFGIDIFQHREDLNGLCFAYELAKVPKEFHKLLKGDAHETQKSLIEEFAELNGNSTRDFFSCNNELFKNPIELRKQKEISLGVDFKSPIENCLYRDL